MTQSHTPTPWKLPLKIADKMEDYPEKSGFVYIVDSSERPWIVAKEIERELAAYIIKCVNAHEELVEALKWSNDIIIACKLCLYHIKDNYPHKMNGTLETVSETLEKNKILLNRMGAA